MSKDISQTSTVDGVLSGLLSLFFIYVFTSIFVGVASSFYLKDSAISSSFLWNIFLANFITVLIALVSFESSYKSKIIALLIFLSASFFLGTYKLSTINYYINSNYHEPEFYPENSEQRKIVTAIIENKDNSFLGKYNWNYLQKVDISKLGNMTNFFITYGNRNEQIKLYESEFKELLNSPFISVWDYSKFENKIIDYLKNSANSLQRNESVSMIYTIKYGV